MADKEDLVYSILQTCETIHGEVTGSVTSLHTHDDLVQLANWLRERMNNWKPSAIRKTAIYDSAVLLLISATLEEWDQHILELSKNVKRIASRR